VNLRAVRRAVTLGCALALCFFRYWVIRVRGPLSLERRALWLQDACRLVLASLGVYSTIRGEPPNRGIVVSNHLSYLDVAILSAAMPCFFVAKAEIRAWPFFGRAARSGGTLFIDRSSLASAEKVAALMSARLDLSVPVLFFPEGTSTDGSSVLRFHGRLFEPAVRKGSLVTAAALRYVQADGAPERDLCWYGDEAFLSHLWKVLGTAGFTAEVRFGESHVYQDRRVAAEATRSEIVTLRSADTMVQQ